MAKHKAPAQVTIASIQQDAPLQLFVDRYWKLGAGVIVLIAAYILYGNYQQRQGAAGQKDVWNELRAQADLGGGIFSQIRGGSVESLALFADEHRDSPVGAWAKALEVGSLVEAEELDGAETVAAQFATLWPEHVLTTGRFFPGPDGKRQSLASTISAGNKAMAGWEKEHAFLFSNPALPADGPRVRLHTNKGTILVGLYVDRAPRHAENFIRLCREGYYDGTKFHRVVRGSLIQGGDPNSIEGEPESWGLGGPEETIEVEADPRLRHFKGALVAWKATGATDSHGSQFFLTTADQNHMDGQTVVFGQILEGEATVEAIESGAVVGDRPQDPAIIERVEVL